MRAGYRLLVGATAVMIAVLSAGMVTAGVKIWQAAERQSVLCSEDGFSWSNGIYEATGTLSGGRLEHLEIRRIAVCGK